MNKKEPSKWALVVKLVHLNKLEISEYSRTVVAGIL